MQTQSSDFDIFRLCFSEFPSSIFGIIIIFGIFFKAEVYSMNRSYIPENQYTRQPLPFSDREKDRGENRTVEAILTFFDLLIAFFTESAVRTTVRAFGAVLCFFAFVFVIGAVEAASLSFGAGVLASLLLFGAAFLCVYRPRKNHS